MLRSIRFWVLLALFYLLVVGGPVIWFMTRPAWPHDAPRGWSYPFSCCSGYDCREVRKSAIGERPSGYVINGTGEVIPYGDSRVKESPDGEFHWCSVAGKDDGKTICLFVPPRSF